MDELIRLSRHLIRTHHRPYERRFLQGNPFRSRFSILLGQRGVGKTTAIVQHVLHVTRGGSESGKVLYVPADHFRVNRSSLYEIAEAFHNTGGELICFDEIHKHSSWSSELKSLYDTFPSLSVIASGSSALEILKGSHDLSRRVIVSRLSGLSFREYAEMRLGLTLPVLTLEDILAHHEKRAETIIRQVETLKKKVLGLFREYLVQGYYPYFTDFPEAEHYGTVVEQGMHTTLEVDLPAVHPALNGASIQKIKKLLSYIASSVPFTPDMRKLKGLMDIGDERTLKTYLSYLEDAGVIRCLPQSGKGLGRLGKPGKIYLNNASQYFAIQGNVENAGSVRETFFLSVLSESHTLAFPPQGDFLVDNEMVFEVGGRKKDFSQVRDLKNAYLALDDMEAGTGRKIPLWLFGFLY